MSTTCIGTPRGQSHARGRGGTRGTPARNMAATLPHEELGDVGASVLEDDVAVGGAGQDRVDPGSGAGQRRGAALEEVDVTLAAGRQPAQREPLKPPPPKKHKRKTRNPPEHAQKADSRVGNGEHTQKDNSARWRERTTRCCDGASDAADDGARPDPTHHPTSRPRACPSNKTTHDLARVVGSGTPGRRMADAHVTYSPSGWSVRWITPTVLAGLAAHEAAGGAGAT